MSLQIAAQHLASKGRGPDTMLVHMAPGEVKGLQALAMAHGGSLTINPQTGLPEAGFLSSLLPMIAGTALTYFSGGTINPLTAGMLIGGGTAVATGSLQKGLMAGLGAYSGAGIGSVIGNAGTAAIEAGATGAGTALPPVADAVPTIAAPPVAATPVSPVIDPTSADFGGAMFSGPPPAAPMPAPITPQPAFDPISGGVLDTSITPRAYDPISGGALDTYIDPARASKEAALREAGPAGRFTRGLSEIGKDPSKLFNQENLKYGLAGLGSLMFQEPKQATYQGSGPNPYQYKYDPNPQTYELIPPSSAERRYFDPRYQRLAEGGSTTEPNPYRYEYDPKTMMYTLKQPKPQQKGSSSNNADPYTAGGPNVDLSPNPFADPNSITNGLIAAMFGGQAPAPVSDAVAVGHEAADGVGMSGMGQGNIGVDLGPAVAASADSGEGPSGGGDSSGSAGGGDGGGDGGSGCVDPAVLIMLADGAYVPAGDIKVGDMLFAMHEKTHEFGVYPVEHSEVIEQPKAVVFFGDGSNMRLSHSHKFLMVGGEWKQVYQLELGDTVKASPGAADKTVTAIEPIGDGPVMKITVKDAHTYISEGLISHNMKARGGLIHRRAGGISHLGDYSDGGRLLRGPGDGVSDSIPAMIANKRPARLADGEFVVPARIVSELGNGSTDAGARKLYAMMDRIQKRRAKTVGENKVAVNSRSEKLLPA